jgi:flagellar M-ring protein FliF
MGNAARLRSLWGNLEPKGQLTLVGSGLLVVVVFFFLFNYASKPSYTAVASGVDPAESGDIAAALDSAGIGYELRNGGTEVAVKSGDEAKARIALADANLGNGNHVGFELFDKKSLGATDFQQQVDYQRALEGEIARTIEEIDGVRTAQLQLVLPEETLFLDEGSKATAAVLLNTSGNLDASAVSGIAHLVSSAVKGLDTQDVTITDATGQLMWPTGDGTGVVSAASKLKAEQVHDAQLSSQVNSVLAQTLGPGKAMVRVKSDLNLDQTTVDKVTYAKKGTALTRKTEKETLDNQGAAGGGAAGTASNIPTYAGQAAAGGGQSTYNRETENVDFGVNKEVQSTTVAPGTVNRLDVALMVDESVPAEQVAMLKNTVASMVGLDANRGDTISTTQVAFAAPEVAEEPAPGPMAALQNPFAFVKWVVLGIGTLLFLFLVRRGLKKREGELVAVEPTWLREIERAMPLAELEAGPAMAALSPADERGRAMRDQLDEIVKNKPEQLAAQVNQWMKEG